MQYINETRAATTLCDNCGYCNTVMIEDDAFELQKFTCTKCGFVGQFKLNRRKFYRKNVALTGYYACTTHPGRCDGQIYIHNISSSGVLFEIVNPSSIKNGDFIRIVFTLDNVHKSNIDAMVEVIRVDGLFVGAKFTTTITNRDFSFYMLP